MKYSILILILFIHTASASIQSDLLKAYESLGFQGNVGSADSYQDQAAGYYTGGSLYARQPVRNSQLVSMHLPNVRAGCGGIDLYLGGFSFISREEFVRLLRQIGSSSLAYAFQLGLQTVSPQIKSTLDQLQATIQDINNTNINSCEAGATLVGSVWPRTDASQNLLCKSMGTHYGQFSDWAASRQGCAQDGSDARAAYRASRHDGEFEDVRTTNINVAWRAIHKNGAIAGEDETLKHIFMSISGTLIITKEDHKVSLRYLPSKATHANFIQGLMRGGENLPTYVCRDEECLDVRERTTRIRPEDGLLYKVDHTLSQIRRKIQENQRLSEEEIGLVTSTNIPILKIILVQLAYRGGGAVINIESFSEIIAHDLLMNYLKDVIDEVENGLMGFDLDEKTRDSFRRDLNDVRRRIEGEKDTLYKKMVNTLRAIDHTLLIEKKMQHDFSRQMQGGPQ